MKLLLLFRWVLVTAFTLVALFYLFMSRAKPDKSPYIVTSNVNKFEPLTLTGDYIALIRIKDSAIVLKESITFLKKDLDSLVAKDLYGGITDSAYLRHMGTLGWQSQATAAGKINLRKTKEMPYRIGLFEKTKNIAVPLLYTPDSIVLDKGRQKPNALTAPGKEMARLNYGNGLDYIPSANSEVKLVARRGLVLATFPPAKPQYLLDADDNEIFVFDPQQIRPLSIEDPEIQTTTVNFQVLHPFYRNAVGQIIWDWSAGKIVGWLMVSLMALFADKIKEQLLQPLVQKVFSPPNTLPRKKVKTR